MRQSLLAPSSGSAPLLSSAPEVKDLPVLLGSFGTFLQIFRLYMGTGLLAFPYAVKCGGLLLAPIVLVVICGFNNYSLRMLVHCKRKITMAPNQSTTLDDLAYAAFGYSGRLFTSIAMVLSLLGLCSGYLIFVGRTLSSAFDEPAWSKVAFSGLDINLFTIISTLIVLPLTMIRNYNRVQWSGIVGNLALTGKSV
jgi:proton-coupled amino acid transporter